jgi:hypothetical protein
MADRSNGPYSGIPFWLANSITDSAAPGSTEAANHNANLAPDAKSAVGHPTTVVYASNLSEHAILEAIRAGHVFIDLEGARDRILEFTGQTGAALASMGDALQAPRGQPIHFTIKMTGLTGAHPEVICDGATLPLVDASPVQRQEETRNFVHASDGKRHWLRVNVRSAEGSLLIVGNPIYLN